MKESHPEHSLLEAEQQKLLEEMNILSQTEGFSHLTERQQLLLKQSLYIQGRSERELEGQYKLSKEHIRNWNCFGSIVNLEQEAGLDLIRPETPEGFFIADYQKVENLEELKKLLKDKGFPLVLHISDTPKGGSAHMYHSCLILGHDDGGKIVIWEKNGMGGSYQITTLEKVYKKYENYGGIYWGVRKLHVAQDEQEKVGT